MIKQALWHERGSRSLAWAIEQMIVTVDELDNTEVLAGLNRDELNFRYFKFKVLLLCNKCYPGSIWKCKSRTH